MAGEESRNDLPSPESMIEAEWVKNDLRRALYLTYLNEDRHQPHEFGSTEYARSWWSVSAAHKYSMSADMFECWVCGEVRPCERGHVLDKCMGGNDVEWNILPMCWFCNRVHKPRHYSMQAALAWREDARAAYYLARESCLYKYLEGKKAVSVHDLTETWFKFRDTLSMADAITEYHRRMGEQERHYGHALD